MNVSSFSKVRNFFSQIVDDVKSRRPLTPMEKKVGIIALAVIAWVVTVWVLYRCHQAVEASAIKQKLAKHNKANNDKADGAFEQLDQEILEEKDASKALPKADPIGQTHTEATKKPAEVEAPVQNLPATDQATIHRSIYRGIDKQANELTMAQLQELKGKFKSYCADKEIQKSFGNQKDDLVYIDFNSFGKGHELYNLKLEVFIRYLILENEIDAYSLSRVGFCLYLTPDAKEPDTVAIKGKRYGRKELLEIDQYMFEQEKKLPLLDSFSADEKLIAENVLSSIGYNHYSRVSTKYVMAPTIVADKIKSYDKKVVAIMDRLVNQGVIHSWNSFGYNGSIIMRIDESDPLPDGQIDSKKWRDKAKIQEEKQFMENNQVDREKWLALNFLPNNQPLPENDREALTSLIDRLNQRVEAGPCTWGGGGNRMKILDKLKAEGLIHSFEYQGYVSSYRINLKESDCHVGFE